MKERLEKFIIIQPVVVQGVPDAHNIFLQVTNQRFCITPYACKTKEAAEWTRDMLCIALEKIVRDVIG